jgi:hypothetical protein
MHLTFDHETDVIMRGLRAPPIVCTSWCVDDGAVDVQLWRDTPVHDMLACAIIDGANTTYDLNCQMAAHPSLIPLVVQAYAEGRVRDVLLDWKLLGIAEGSLIEGQNPSLKQLAAELGIGMEKDDWRKRFGALKNVPVKHWPEGAQNYSRDDTVATRAARKRLQEREVPWTRAGVVVLGQHAALAAAAAWALDLASCHGVCTDPRRTQELSDRVNAHLDEIRGDLIESGMIRRTGDMREYAKRTKGLDKDARYALIAAGDGPPDGKRSDLCAAARMIRVMTEAGRRRQIQLAEAGEEEYKARVRAGEDATTVHEELIRQVRRGRALVKLDRDAAILSGDEMLIARADYVTSIGLLGRVERMKMGYTLPLQTRWDSLKETFRTSSTQNNLDEEDASGVIGEQMQNFPRGKKEEAYGLREAFCPRSTVPYIHWVPDALGS